MLWEVKARYLILYVEMYTRGMVGIIGYATLPQPLSHAQAIALCYYIHNNRGDISGEYEYRSI